MSVAPVNSPQAMNREASVKPIAGKTAPFGSETQILPIPVYSLNVQQLAIDAVSVVAQDSVRSGSVKVEPKLVSSYVGSSALFQLYGNKLLMPLLKDIDPSIRYELGKVLWNSVGLPVSARIFGGRISVTNSILTSAGSEFFAKGLNIVINK